MPATAHDKHEKHDKNQVHHQLIERLRRHGQEVSRMTQGLDEQQLSSRPEQDTWSLKELVAHMRRVQQVFASRVDAMLTEDNPTLESYSPEKDSELAPMMASEGHRLVEDFLKERETFAHRLERLGSAAWHRTAKHPEFPDFDVHFQIEYLVHHEASHLYQMFVRRVPFGKLPH